jgi:ankyrin repeat protein
LQPVSHPNVVRTLFFIFHSFLLFACSEPSAKQLLGERGIPFTEEEFLKSIEKEDIAITRLFLQAGLTPRTRGEFGKLIYEKVIAKSSAEFLSEFISYGADPEQDLDGSGKRPLMVAAENNNLKAAKFLIGRKVNLDVADSHGATALHYAIRNKHPATVELLLKAGAKTNEQPQPLLLAVDRNQIEIVKLLLAANADLEARESQAGLSALALAAFRGHADLVDLLLGAGSDPSAQDSQGQTALMIAVDRGETDVVEVFIRKGVSVNRPGSDGVTALMIAAAKGDCLLINKLLDAGADRHAVTTKGYTASMAAREGNHMEAIKLLTD